MAKWVAAYPFTDKAEALKQKKSAENVGYKIKMTSRKTTAYEAKNYFKGAKRIYTLYRWM